MGQIDHFLTATATPGLLPGERVHAVGHLKEVTSRSILNVPQGVDHWLAVATNLRLILFRTTAGGMFGQKPRGEAREPRVCWYDEIESIRHEARSYGQLVPGGCPTTFYFVPRTQLGPFEGKRFSFDVYRVAEGIDAQDQFATQFLPWLGSQVAAGAFPLAPEKQAQLQERMVAAEAKYQVTAAANREAEARRAAFLKKNAPTMIGGALWLVLFAAAMFLLYAGIHDKGVADFYIQGEEERVRAAEHNLDQHESGALKRACESASSSCTCKSADKYTEWTTHDPSKAEADGWQVVAEKKNSGHKYYCPPRSYYESVLRYAKKDLATREEALGPALLKIVGGVIAVLVALGVGAALLVWRKRHASRAVAA